MGFKYDGIWRGMNVKVTHSLWKIYRHHKHDIVHARLELKFVIMEELYGVRQRGTCHLHEVSVHKPT